MGRDSLKKRRRNYQPSGDPLLSDWTYQGRGLWYNERTGEITDSDPIQ